MPVTIRGSGQVPVQVIQVIKTDTFSTTSTSFVDVTGLTVNITPTSSANKILIIAQVNGSGPDHSGFRLARNGSGIYVGDSVGGLRTLASAANFYFGPSNSLNIENATIVYLDSPATTSSTTYNVQAMIASASTFFVNRSSGDDAANYSFRVPCSITVMEISG
jgi:hypothetical protein